MPPKSLYPSSLSWLPHVLRAKAQWLWVTPTAVTVGLVVLAIHTSFVLPAPFLILLACLIPAGAFGGLAAGVLAGLLSVAALYYSHINNFGPPQLTAEVPQMAFAMMVYFMVSTALGSVRNHCDVAVARLKKTENDLEVLLRDERDKGRERSAQLADGTSRLEMALRIAGIGHYTWNYFTGECEFCSDQHAAHFGLTAKEYRELTIGKAPYTGFVHEDDKAHFIECINRTDRGEALYFEYRVIQPSGKIRFLRQIDEPVFNEAGEQVAVVGASFDLTDLREAEARLRQSQRIEAIGTLTGGVAHDFNNLLAIILGNLEMTIGYEDPAGRDRMIEQAIAATQRGASLTRNLLSFSRRAHLSPTRLNINEVVNNTMEWSSRVLPATIAIENSLMAGLWDTELDSTSVENAIINILLNARDAMQGGGRLTIKTANRIIEDEDINDGEEDMRPGRYVMLAISDTGHGIAPAELDTVFEPFFTKKPVGHGSGLGLSMVQGFIRQSGGAIRIYSEVGVGTTFKLYFQAMEQSESTAVRPRPAPAPTIEEGTRILLAEDEDEVRRILKLMLEAAGHSVVTASSGDKAFDAFKHEGKFDLLITDVVMPGQMQGLQLAKQIRHLQPEINCIFLSGYATEGTVHANGLKPTDIRLIKPVSRPDFLAAVSIALGNKPH